MTKKPRRLSLLRHTSDDCAPDATPILCMMGNDFLSFLTKDVDQPFVNPFRKTGVFVVQASVGANTAALVQISAFAHERGDTACAQSRGAFSDESREGTEELTLGESRLDLIEV